MSLFGFGPSCDVEFELDKSGGGGGGGEKGSKEPRKSVEVLEDGKKVKQLIYYDGEDVTGTVHIRLKKPGTKIDHQGIRLEFVGQIELYYDRSNHHVFSSLSKLLAYPGEITENMSVDFNFPAVDKPHESYNGVNVKLRYFLRLTIIKRFSNITKEEDIFVHTLSAYPELNSSIKMEVGIEDCLHIEFEYNKSKYHLRDVIIGKIYFLLVRIKVKYMELAIIKREIIGDNAQNETETVAKYEIMDGAPVKGESIPIRLFLSAYNLTPTMRDIQKKFSCKYYLNLVLVDEEERRYFKQQEIILWRKADKYKSKQERSDQMQVYEPSQPMHTGEGNQSSGRYTSNRSGGGGGKLGANNNGGGGTGGGSSANRVRHDENGDLLDDEDDEDTNNNNGGGGGGGGDGDSGGDESDDEAGLVSNTVSKSKPVNNNTNATPKKQQDQFFD